MDVIKYVVFFALVGLVIWLTIDTIIYIVRKVKQKKKDKAKEVVDTQQIDDVNKE